MEHNLTNKHRERLFDLWCYISTEDRPTYRKIKEALNYHSNSGVADDLRILTELGYIAERHGEHSGIHTLVKAGKITSTKVDNSSRIGYT